MWIFWHDWWPWYVLAFAAILVATGVVWVVRYRRWTRPKPCVPITCPPAEKITVEGTLVYFVCPECGRPLEARWSCGEGWERDDYVCREHGIQGHTVRLDKGELDLGVNE